jgi:broad-specificity NMP kinase
MNQENIFFIIGPNGVGKTTIIPLLEKKLPNSFEVHDFDERGVPDNADKLWRKSETVHWLDISKANLLKGISTIVCGFMKPDEIVEASKSLHVNPTVCFLDIDKQNLESRLLGRYQTEESIRELERATNKTVEKFIQDNVYVTSLLKKDSEQNNFKIIDTSNVHPDEVAERVYKWITTIHLNNH